MPGHDYKTPGVLRAAFQYQDLVAVETLIDFYRQRDRYEWVQLDAEDHRFRSVDDVVACRPDGTYELTQVKFTPDPDAERNTLSWQWLTTARPHGTSLLQKWATTTLLHESRGTLATASLKTDRVPSPAFAKCLNGSRVVYERLSARTKALVDQQLGSSNAAARFFGCFNFIHSQSRLDDLQNMLWSRIASDTDRGGWAMFHEQVRRWSTHKQQPAPDGKIRYIHLRQAFSVERSKPLPQDFQVPHSYSVPDDRFANDFVQEIVASDGITVLWGPPGRGKSTYLSRCIAEIEESVALCIRHHYFLNVRDRSEGRFHYHAIVQSLVHQIERSVPSPDGPKNDLTVRLSHAADVLRSQGRRLIIVIDGLDHVWRDHRDHEEMEALFAALLPLPTNVRLVVGTQKIASQHLPQKLLRALPLDRWTELPLMSEAAVGRWLRHQEAAGRLNLRVDRQDTSTRAMRAVARALHQVSRGLPLHLIYSFEALVRSGTPVDAQTVADLPACPTGDIRDYYRAFWERTGPKAKEILHVLAGLKFGPPPFAMRQCFGDRSDDLAALDEINHLLDYQETEVHPFHASLFAFIRDLPSHKSCFSEYSSGVLKWLERDAPNYWKWAWLWITAAQRGDSSGLLIGPSREWAVNALVAGYPIEQIVTILDHAERVALDAFDLLRLVRYRRLKVRALNGPEFQTNEWPRFMEVALSLSPDPYPAEVLCASRDSLPGGVWPFLIRTARRETRPDLAQKAIDQLNRRLEGHRTSDVPRSNQQHQAAEDIVAVLGGATSNNTDRVVRFAKRTPIADGLLVKYAQASILARRFSNVLSAAKLWSSPRFDRYLLAALSLEGLAPSARPELKGLSHPAIRCLALLKGDAAIESSSTDDLLSQLFVENADAEPGFTFTIRSVLYDTFFAVLAQGLFRGSTHGSTTMSRNTHPTWLGTAVQTFERLAERIASQWRDSRHWPALREIYCTLRLDAPATNSRRDQSSLIGVRLAFLDIAVDLCTIATALDAHALIDSHDIESVVDSPLWLDELWLDASTEHRLPLHTCDASGVLAERVSQHLDTTITEFHDRVGVSAKLAMFAADNGVQVNAVRELRRAAECLLGYGYHKDLFAWEVLDALDHLAKHGDTEAKDALLDLAGEFTSITTYTDGDETGSVREDYYRILARYFPEKIPNCYSHLVKQEEWYYAQTVADAMVAIDDLESPTGRALLSTYILPSETRALEAEDMTERPYAMAALAAVHRRTGRTLQAETVQDETASGTPMPSTNRLSGSGGADTVGPDPADWPPSRIREYLAAQRGAYAYTDQGERCVEWLRYWASAGKADEALSHLESLISDRRSYASLASALDVAFQVSLATQGRSSAFRWLCLAHIANDGWDKWYSRREEARTRMKRAAHHYPERWCEFIVNTARSRIETRTEHNGIALGLSRLIYFLVEVEQLELARAYAFALVGVFRDELTEQPIDVPTWSK